VPTFTAPVSDLVPPILPDTRGPALGLFRHYKSRAQGRNVYIVNGVASENSPTGSDVVTRVFYGGHDPESITAAEAVILTAAGYGSLIS
jgi:hypothetical protein